ncbi:MAG: cytochrome c oxidase subunit 3 [Aggregatilineales bacterium]
MQYTDNYQPEFSREEREQQRIERDAEVRMKNNRMGIAIFQGSWIMVFVCLIVVNWQLRYSPEWMIDGAEIPNPILPTVATAVILLSTFLSWRALKAVKADNVQVFLSQWRNAFLLGGVFLVIMISQFFTYLPGGGQFVFVYRVMIGYHALHTAFIGLMMVQVWRYGKHGAYHSENHWSIEATLNLWYFVTVAWVLFYIVLYLMPQP